MALVFSGCGFKAMPADTPSGGDIDAGGVDVAPADAAIDGASLDGRLPSVCLGTFINVCVDPPQSSITLPAAIDTGSSDLCAPYTSNPHIDACVIAGQSINLPSGTTTVTGRKPLILLSTDSISIAGVLDAASHQGKPNGPAADTGCPTAGQKNPTRGNQGGGGWGGGFGTTGGDGGDGVTGNGGTASKMLPPPTLHGGCPGSDGADNGLRNGGGSRGHGGGAIVLLATAEIAIDGTVNASGGAARGSGGGLSGGAGGGGGGSGGMIVLEATTVRISGACFANGGGGGEGGSGAGGNNGAESSAPGSVGAGGRTGSSAGGDGGDGAFGATPSVPGSRGSRSGRDSGGGGGGGGGAGVIKVVAPVRQNTTDATRISPLPT
jgi:hypothetical protein